MSLCNEVQQFLHMNTMYSYWRRWVLKCVPLCYEVQPCLHWIQPTVMVKINNSSSIIYLFMSLYICFVSHCDMWGSFKKCYSCPLICSFVDCRFTYSLPDSCHPTTSLFYLYSVLSFVSISKLVDMLLCFWCSISCFHFALCLKVWLSLHIVCRCMIEECIWYQWGRSKLVYHIIDWWQKSTLMYWELLKQWNSIRFRRFWEAILVRTGEEVTNDHDSYVVHMKQYAMFQTEICYLNSWKSVIRNTTLYCNLYVRQFLM